MVDAGADGRIMLIIGGLRIYQGMNIKIGSSRKKRGLYEETIPRNYLN